MKNKTLQRIFYSLSALSLLTLAACDKKEEAPIEEGSEVSSTVEKTDEGSGQLDDIEARIKALYQEAEEIEESDGMEETEEEGQETEDSESQELEDVDGEEDQPDLSEEDVDLEAFEKDEALSDDISKLEDELDKDEGVERLQELSKEYGVIQTMYNVKKALIDRYDIEKDEVIEESDLPADFMMQLKSLEEIKPVFYNNYMAYYEAFSKATGIQSEQSEEESKQSRINAIRAQIIAGDGSISSAVSTAQLQTYYNELLALGASDTAQAVANEVSRRNNPSTANSEPVQAPTESAAPASPIQSNQPIRTRSTGGQGSVNAPSSTTQKPKSKINTESVSDVEVIQESTPQVKPHTESAPSEGQASSSTSASSEAAQTSDTGQAEGFASGE